MIALSKRYINANVSRIIVCAVLFLFVCVDNRAQSQSIGHGVYIIFNDYAHTHWKSADSIEQVLDHISYYPKWKKEDLKESIAYLQSRNGYVYYSDSVMCYFNGDVCAFELPRVVQPCELIADTTIDAYLKKIKVASVCFNNKGHVVYSASFFSEKCVSQLKKRIYRKKSQNLAADEIWIPLVIKKETKSVQNYCTQEYLDSNKQTALILRYVRAIWTRYPEVTEVRIGLHFP